MARLAVGLGVKAIDQGFSAQFYRFDELLVGDEALTAAILDRLLHNAHAINIKGRSYRLRDLEQTLGVRTN